MEITPEQVARKAQIGWLDGAPVFEVETIGGYNVIVTMRNGKLEPLGVGPHRAVARHIARKREPGLQLTELAKSDLGIDPNGRIVRAYESVTDAVRKKYGLK